MGTLTRGNLDERLKDLGAHLRDLGVGLVDEARARGVDATIDQYPYTPATMIASDGEVPVFGEASPHPRSYGTFVRVLGRYVRGCGLAWPKMGTSPSDPIIVAG